eukprot:768822-Hanusia_phi.AAC.11
MLSPDSPPGQPPTTLDLAPSSPSPALHAPSPRPSQSRLTPSLACFASRPGLSQDNQDRLFRATLSRTFEGSARPGDLHELEPCGCLGELAQEEEGDAEHESLSSSSPPPPQSECSPPLPRDLRSPVLASAAARSSLILLRLPGWSAPVWRHTRRPPVPGPVAHLRVEQPLSMQTWK